MIRLFIIAAFLLLTAAGFAQSSAVLKIAQQTSTENLKNNLYYLASNQLEGRLMASHGDTLASLFVADWFRKNNLVAPYDNGKNYFQSIKAYKKILFKDELIIEGHTYASNDGFLSTGNADFEVDNLPVQYAGYADTDSLFQHLSVENVKGKAVIIQFNALLNSLIKNNGPEHFLAKLKEKGIKLLLFCHPAFSMAVEDAQHNSFLPEYVDSLKDFTKSDFIPVLALSEERMNSLLSGDKTNLKILEDSYNKTPAQSSFELKTKISAFKKAILETVYAPNVIGVIKGTDAKAGCIILSAHHDHDGRNGNEIYYGATDNASGTVAIMEIARLMSMAVEKDNRPKRTIVFASFTGEERGLLGSTYYSQNPVYPIEETYAVLNIDMLGRVDSFYSGKKADSNYAYILVKDSLNRGLRNALYKANESSVHLKLDTYYEQPQYALRRITGSDQYPFYLKRIPFIRIDCGFTKDYHKPTDTPDKINYELLTMQTQLAFLTLWNLAND